MDEPDWERIEQIYHEARKLPPDQRRNFVEKAAADDPFVMRSVLELLEAAGSADHILDEPIAPGLLSSPDQLVGQTIGERYFIERELGGGGMGEVYLAQDRRLHDLPVVIKFLARELMGDSYARQKFKQESEALSRIKHAGVVRVLDNNELPDGRPYFVMEFIDGDTLRPQIQSGGMNLRRAATILKQIGAALDHAHQQGVIHRDLKPENILLKRGTDDVVLIDFGIAKVRDSAVAPTTTPGPSAGTLMYMSPEQLRGQKVTPASDIYSLAVIAYEMVTGQRPFNADSAARLSELQKKRVRVRPRRLREDLPADAEAMILRGLKFDPGARHERAGDFGDRLADALVDSGRARFPWPKVIRAALVIMIGIMILLGIRKIIYPPPPPEPNRSFTYYLTVQRMRDGQPYGEPRKSHGDEPYSTGDRFQVTVSTPVPAYLYIFHEGPPEDKETGFKLIYPRRTTNNGSASLGANQPVQTEWYSFEGLAAAENFWFVWSTSPVHELDAATSVAFKHPQAGLTGQTLIAVRQFLTTKEAEIDATTYNYNANQNAVVRGKHDLLVTLAQFRHR